MSTATVEQVPTGTFNVDPVHSTFGFVVTHNGVSKFRGHFEQVDAKLEGGALTGTANVDSVKTAIPQLKDHLVSPEFFNAAETPTVEFRSTTEIRDRRRRQCRDRRRADGSRRDQARHGKGQLSRPVAEHDWRRASSASTSRPTIDRRDYGLNWQAQLPTGGEVLGLGRHARGSPRVHPPGGVAAMLRILGISGSLRTRFAQHERCSGRRPTCCRPGSSSTSTTAFATLPPYDPDLDVPELARLRRWSLLREMISCAPTAVLIATPEYNGSIPGVLKNALDWASRPVPGQRSPR